MLTQQELMLTVLVLLPFLLLPTFIALWRGHLQLLKVIAVNLLLLPAFGIGWVIALLMAVTGPGRDGRLN